jgi:hypothetical protein
LRQGDRQSLGARAGLLGGSQAGARFSYRLNDDVARPLAISGRLYWPLRDAEGSEVALGVEWKPSKALPVTLLAERRQAIGKRGRSAFALLAYGGLTERRVAGPLDLEVYAQAGRSRDELARPVRRWCCDAEPADRRSTARTARVGAWAGAQPGVARLDLGPQLSYRLPVADKSVRLSAEWRFRIAGDAAPGSGPALTLSTAF